jgi:predicted nucleic acid-binding protein
MLIDSNLIIYAVQPVRILLRKWIIDNATHYSVISKVEVLGYPKLTQEGVFAIENVFQYLEMLLISHLTAQIAVQLRQQHKMSLGDAFIAATCLEHNLPLATRNTKDFIWIDDLTVYNPFTEN